MTLLLKSVKTFTIEQVKQAASSADYTWFDHLIADNPLVPYGQMAKSLMVNWSVITVCVINI